jgi:hypothetical protein
VNTTAMDIIITAKKLFRIHRPNEQNRGNNTPFFLQLLLLMLIVFNQQHQKLGHLMQCCRRERRDRLMPSQRKSLEGPIPLRKLLSCERLSVPKNQMFQVSRLEHNKSMFGLTETEDQSFANKVLTLLSCFALEAIEKYSPE